MLRIRGIFCTAAAVPFFEKEDETPLVQAATQGEEEEKRHMMPEMPFSLSFPHWAKPVVLGFLPWLLFSHKTNLKWPWLRPVV